MRLSVIQQPYADEPTVASFLREVAEDPGVDAIDICVAWALRSGLDQVTESLVRFRGRGGRLRLIVGIDLGSATRQGLEAARELAPENAYVFHQPGRTFHPKLYAAYGYRRASIVVGSQNLTSGGLGRNFELGTRVDLDESDSEHLDAYAREVRHYVDTMIEDREVCIALTGNLVTTLMNNPRYLIRDEDEARESRPSESSEVVLDSLPIFGRSNRRLRNPGRGQAAQTARSGGSKSAAESSEGRSSRAPSPEQVVQRWFKKLPRSNVNRLIGSHPQNHLTLTQSRHPIDQATYFRVTLFAVAAWAPVDQESREAAYVDFEVVARGLPMGIFNLRVDHYPKFSSDQSNRETTIRWGEELGAYLKSEVNHTGDYVTVEYFSSGNFKMTFSNEPIGPFYET